MKVLLVGGGITSAITGMYIRKIMPDCNLIMWDKAKGMGGRMSTSRSTLNTSYTADIGAQYITTTASFIQSNNDIYHDLFSRGILQPLKCEIIGLKSQKNNKNFVVPKGTGFLVKYISERANFNEIKFSYQVSSINKENDKWIVETMHGEKQNFDIVILTIPVPQLFLLKGTAIDEINSDLIKKLETVTYSSRYVLVLFFIEKLDEKWGAQYLDNHTVFRYVAIDDIKRNQENNSSSVVFHTTVQFGQKHVEESLSEIEQLLLSQAKRIFPNWPEPYSKKCHKWRYSQVTNAYPGNPGFVMLSFTPPLLIGGDGFMGSTFDNCITSSKMICNKLKEIFNLT